MGRFAQIWGGLRKAVNSDRLKYKHKIKDFELNNIRAKVICKLFILYFTFYNTRQL